MGSPVGQKEWRRQKGEHWQNSDTPCTACVFTTATCLDPGAQMCPPLHRPTRRPSSLRSFTSKASPSTAGKEKSARGSESLADRGLRGDRLQGHSSTRSPSLWMLQISFPLGIWVHLTAPPFITKYLEVLSALTVCSPSFHSFLNPPIGFCTVALPPTQLLSRSPMPLTP